MLNLKTLPNGDKLCSIPKNSVNKIVQSEGITSKTGNDGTPKENKNKQMKFSSWVPLNLQKEVEFNFLYNFDAQSTERIQASKFNPEKTHEEVGLEYKNCSDGFLLAHSHDSIPDSDKGSILVESFGCSSDSDSDDCGDGIIFPQSSLIINLNFETSKKICLPLISLPEENFEIYQIGKVLKVDKLLGNIETKMGSFGILAFDEDFKKLLEIKLKQVVSFQGKLDRSTLRNLMITGNLCLEEKKKMTVCYRILCRELNC